MIRDYTDEFFDDLTKAINDGLRAAALEGETSAMLSMKPAPGEEGQKISTRPSSPPGSPPFARRGGAGLRGSISHQRTGYLAWGFGTNIRYGRHLEYGATLPGGQPFWKDKDGNLRFASRSSPHASRMAKTKPSRLAPRPWLRPVLVRDRLRLEDAFVDASRLRLARGVTRG